MGLANPAGGANLSRFSSRAPDATAASGSRALDLNFTAAAWLVAAATGAGIEFPSSRVTDTFRYDRTRDMVGFGLPFPCAVLNVSCLVNGTTHRVADIPVASLGFSTPCGAGHVTIAGVVNWAADRVVALSVTGVVHRATNALGDFPVTGLVDRPANRLTDIAIASLMDRAANLL